MMPDNSNIDKMVQNLLADMSLKEKARSWLNVWSASIPGMNISRIIKSIFSGFSLNASIAYLPFFAVITSHPSLSSISLHTLMTIDSSSTNVLVSGFGKFCVKEKAERK